MIEPNNDDRTPEAIYEEGLQQLEDLHKKGLLESDEAEELRDRLDVVWVKISPEVCEQIERRVQGR